MKKFFILALFAITCLSCVFAVACKKDKPLSAPQNLQINAEVLSWDKVDGAKGYVVNINGTKYETKETSLDIFLLTDRPKRYDILVKASGNDGNLWSEEIIHQVYPLTILEKNLSKDGKSYEIRKIDTSTAKGKVIVPSYASDGKPITAVAGFAGTEVKSVILPNTIEKTFSFAGCETLERVKLPEFIESLRTECFKNCKSLKSIDLPMVSSLFGDAFIGCDSLTEIYLPSTLKTIHGIAFEGCKNLKTITVDPKNKHFRMEGNCLIENDGDVLRRVLSGEEIPKSVKVIGHGAFYDNEEIREVVIPGHVKRVGLINPAFYNCPNLTSVVIEEGVEYIEGFDDGLVVNCDNVQSISLPASLKEIDPWLIKNCPNLKELTISKDHPVYMAEGLCIIQKDTKTLVSGNKNSKIPDWIEVIGNKAFYGREMQNIELPNVLKEIEEYAFYGCYSLKSIEIPTSVTKIKKYAFSGCFNLEEVFISESIETIEEYAFASCPKLRSVILPKKFTSIPEQAFDTQIKVPTSIYTELPYSLDLWETFREAYHPTYFVGFEEYKKFIYMAFDCVLKYEGDYPYVYSTKINLKEAYKIGPPCRKGYKFLGWSLEDGGEIITPEEAENSTASKETEDTRVVVYSIWEKL